MFRLKPSWVAVVPAAVFLLAVGGVWVVAAVSGVGAGVVALVGCVMLWLLMATVAGIVAAAATQRRGSLLNLVVVAVLLAGVAGVVLAGWSGGLALACLFGAWVMLWSGASRALRRLGPGVAVVVPMVLAGLCMASPVVAMPLVRSAAHWGAVGDLAWQGRVVEVVRHACPFFAVLDVMPEGRGGLRSNWATLPGMYRWSGLGQEVPMLLPNVWVCVGFYAALAAILWVGIWWWRRRTNGQKFKT